MTARFAGRVTGPLDVGRILQQREDTALAVLGKGVQVERPCHRAATRSILKSPVWITTPTGVSMARATQSTSECVTRIGSMVNGPMVNFCRGVISIRSISSSSSCSSSLPST